MKKQLIHFFCRETIYALRPESFCPLKVAIRKVQTFWASGATVQEQRLQGASQGAGVLAPSGSQRALKESEPPPMEPLLALIQCF